MEGEFSYFDTSIYISAIILLSAACYFSYYLAHFMNKSKGQDYDKVTLWIMVSIIMALISKASLSFAAVLIANIDGDHLLHYI